MPNIGTTICFWIFSFSQETFKWQICRSWFIERSKYIGNLNFLTLYKLSLIFILFVPVPFTIKIVFSKNAIYSWNAKVSTNINRSLIPSQPYNKIETITCVTFLCLVILWLNAHLFSCVMYDVILGLICARLIIEVELGNKLNDLNCKLLY